MTGDQNQGVSWFKTIYPNREERDEKSASLGGRPGLEAIYNSLIDIDFQAFATSVRVRLNQQGQPIDCLSPP